MSYVIPESIYNFLNEEEKRELDIYAREINATITVEEGK